MQTWSPDSRRAGVSEQRFNGTSAHVRLFNASEWESVLLVYRQASGYHCSWGLHRIHEVIGAKLYCYSYEQSCIKIWLQSNKYGHKSFKDILLHRQKIWRLSTIIRFYTLKIDRQSEGWWRWCLPLSLCRCKQPTTEHVNIITFRLTSTKITRACCLFKLFNCY